MNNDIKTNLFLVGLSALLLLIGWLIAKHAGFFIALIFSLLIIITAYWYADKQILFFYQARPANESSYSALFSIVKMLSEKANMPMPKLYVIESATPNALSIGRNPQVASIVVTSALMKILNQDELTAVLAYELVRIQERDTWLDSVSASLGHGILKFGSVSAWFGLNKSSVSTERTFGMIIFAPFAAGIVRIMHVGKREFALDQKAAQLCGNASWLASALKKIDEHKAIFPTAEANPASSHLFIVDPLKHDKVNTLFAVQSPIADRIQHLTT